jgi:DMSO/TMAO reductase YedYZ heme-binding membrane subunit
MKREDLNYIVSFLLLISICITGIAGYIQSRLELRRFVPHRNLAYVTLALAAIHVALNAGRIWRYLRRKLKRKR